MFPSTLFARTYVRTYIHTVNHGMLKCINAISPDHLIKADSQSIISNSNTTAGMNCSMFIEDTIADALAFCTNKAFVLYTTA
jgi:hypothetical protein